MHDMATIIDYYQQFDALYISLPSIDSSWYKEELGIHAFCSTAKVKDAKGKYSEEYIRARFVYALVHS
jgi:type I restriction enzyme M protein